MAEAHKAAKNFVWVRKKRKSIYLSRKRIERRKHSSKEELNNCVDDATMGINIGD